MCRSSHRRCSVRKGFLRNFAKFTGKHLCQSLFFNKVACLRPSTLALWQRLWHRCFPVNFANLLRTPFLRKTSERLLLNVTRFGHLLKKSLMENFVFLFSVFRRIDSMFSCFARCLAYFC